MIIILLILSLCACTFVESKVSLGYDYSSSFVTGSTQGCLYYVSPVVETLYTEATIEDEIFTLTLTKEGYSKLFFEFTVNAEEICYEDVELTITWYSALGEEKDSTTISYDYLYSAQKYQLVVNKNLYRNFAVSLKSHKSDTQIQQSYAVLVNSVDISQEFYFKNSSYIVEPWADSVYLLKGDSSYEVYIVLFKDDVVVHSGWYKDKECIISCCDVDSFSIQAFR